MTLKVKHIPIQYVAQAWPMVEKYIADALQYGGDDYTIEQVKVYLATGQWILLAALDEENKFHGAATVTFINYPNDRVAFIVFMGGKLVSSKDTFEQMGAILKEFGATKIQGAVRESMAKFSCRYGFKERYRVIETRL